MALIKKDGYGGAYKIDLGNDEVANQFGAQLVVTQDEVIAAMNADGRAVTALFSRILKERAKAHAALLEKTLLD